MLLWLLSSEDLVCKQDLKFNIFTHAAITMAFSSVFKYWYVCVSVYICAVKGNWLELSAPKSVEIYPRQALDMHWSWVQNIKRLVRHGSAWWYDCTYFHLSWLLASGSLWSWIEWVQAWKFKIMVSQNRSACAVVLREVECNCCAVSSWQVGSWERD